MIDSGSICNLITKILANEILKITPSLRWIPKIRDKGLITFSNEPIKVFGKIANKIIYNEWICEDARLRVVEDGPKLIIGGEFFSRLGLAVVIQQATRVNAFIILIILHAK